MRRFKLLVFFFSMLTFFACAGERSNISLLVIDDNGKPLEDAHVTLSFFSEIGDRTSRGKTDQNGRYNASKLSTLQTSFYIRKYGYYDSHGQFGIGDKGEKIVLREIINPIPMYAKREDLWVGRYKQNEWIGYDLFEGDFVKPYGAGLISDLEVKHTVDRQDMWSYFVRYSLRFPNENDGLIPYFDNNLYSDFDSAYSAPISGYAKEWDFYKKRNGSLSEVETNFDMHRNYYFRVRTEMDDQGSVVSAFYGKTYGEFGNFHYYLNPNMNDRNLEFHLGQNLFHNLSSKEEVRKP